MNNLPPFEAAGMSPTALFDLKIFRGEGMALLGMNWKNDAPPPSNFVGFAISYSEPGNPNFHTLPNRLNFPDASGKPIPGSLPSTEAPIQKFRWVHFPYHPDYPGDYTYRVIPAFMDAAGKLTFGDLQEAAIALGGETIPGALDIAFTRGFVSSQSYSQWIKPGDDENPLLPPKGADHITFKSKNPDHEHAYEWMGLKARKVIFKLLDDAIADETAEVRVMAYDLDEPEIISRLNQLEKRLKIIIDCSGTHGAKDSPEDTAETMLVATAGRKNVQRQKAGGLQHNKTIAVSGKVQRAIGGSTNLSWRGLYIQNNNAVVVEGAGRVKLFFDAFDKLWDNKDKPGTFDTSTSATWNNLGIEDLDGNLTFSPHDTENACLQKLADDIADTESSLFYSLAFLNKTPGVIMNSLIDLRKKAGRFIYGIANLSVKQLQFDSPNGSPAVVFPSVVGANAALPFLEEEAGGGGIRMHHKFVVIDFDKPTARVYTGSYNFSIAADTANGENLWLFKDRRVAVSYMIQAVAMFDHFEWRDAFTKAKEKGTVLCLKRPPVGAEQPWFHEDYVVPQKIKDRKLFCPNS